MEVVIEIKGKLEVSEGDFEILKKVSSESVTQTLLASGTDIQVSIREVKESTED